MLCYVDCMISVGVGEDKIFCFNWLVYDVVLLLVFVLFVSSMFATYCLGM